LGVLLAGDLRALTAALRDVADRFFRPIITVNNGGLGFQTLK
jgi:hypothetical protein